MYHMCKKHKGGPTIINLCLTYVHLCLHYNMNITGYGTISHTKTQNILPYCPCSVICRLECHEVFGPPCVVDGRRCPQLIPSGGHFLSSSPPTTLQKKMLEQCLPVRRKYEFAIIHEPFQEVRWDLPEDTWIDPVSA